MLLECAHIILCHNYEAFSVCPPVTPIGLTYSRSRESYAVWVWAQKDQNPTCTGVHWTLVCK